MSGTTEARIDRELRQLWNLVEDCVVPRLGLRPVALPPPLALASGLLEGNVLTLRTQRYGGAGGAALTLAAIATAKRQLCTLTVLGIPPLGASWPVLGIDLIALRGTLALVAVDLAPLDPAFWQRRCAPLLQALRTHTQDALVPRKRPAFTVETFSPLAVIGGARVGSEAAVCAGIAQLLDATSLLLSGESASALSQSAWGARASWLAAEKQNRKEHDALSRIFGPRFAAYYLDEFLFVPPEKWSADAPSREGGSDAC